MREDSEDIDYPYYVTAHELGHQWWAHQVVAADVEGSQMLMESITHFCAINVLEQNYGKVVTKRFLRDESLKYINSRKGEPYYERPLSKVAGYQSSIYYQKGGVSMKALANYLGKELIFNTLKKVIDSYAFQRAPYPTTLEFENILDVPDSLKYYADDMLNKITFYDNDVREATYERNEDLEYFLAAKIEGEKFYANGKGEEMAAEMNDWVEVGIYTTDNEEIYLNKIQIKGGEHVYHFKLDRKPAKIVIDPYYSLIDKDYSREVFDVKRNAD